MPAPTLHPVQTATIRYWMARRHFSQQALADAVGVKQPAVANWLKEETTRMDFSTGLKLAAVLGIAPEDLLRPPPTGEATPLPE